MLQRVLSTLMPSRYQSKKTEQTISDSDLGNIKKQLTESRRQKAARNVSIQLAPEFAAKVQQINAKINSMSGEDAKLYVSDLKINDTTAYLSFEADTKMNLQASANFLEETYIDENIAELEQRAISEIVLNVSRDAQAVLMPNFRR